MTLVYQQDYILRLIEQVGAVLRAIRDAMRQQRPDEAIEMSREALHEVTGLPPQLAESLAPDSLLALLPEPRRVLLVAELLIARAEAFGERRDLDRASAERRKALALLVAVRDTGNEDEVAEAERLMGELTER